MPHLCWVAQRKPDPRLLAGVIVVHVVVAGFTWRHPASRSKPDSWPEVGVALRQRSTNGQLARLLAFRTQVGGPWGTVSSPL